MADFPLSRHLLALPEPLPACRCGRLVMVRGGPGEDYGHFVVWEVCVSCYWTDFRNYNAEKWAEYEAKEPAITYRRRLEKTRIPKATAALVNNDTRLEPTDGMGVVREFNKRPRRFLVLAGGYGTGKSVAAAWLVWWHWGRFISAPRLAAMNMYDAGSWEPLLSVPWLAVDDYGREYAGKGAAAAKFDALLCDRHAEGNITVLTTNLSPEEFQGAISSRLKDRFAKDGIYRQLTGRSMRRETNVS